MVPEINPVIPFSELTKFSKNHELSFIFWEKENHSTLREILNKHNDTKSIMYLIGPEGGFSESEIVNAEKNDILSVSLGKTIIRSETAAIYAMSIFNFYYF